MTFEEKKQEIIQNITKIQHNTYRYSKSIISLNLEHLVIYELKELQPDKPKCSTCKYLKQESKQSWCGYEDSPIMEFYTEYNPENFGCIYHEEK